MKFYLQHHQQYIPGGHIRHTPAIGAGSKEEWYDKDINALSIITNCLELSRYVTS